MGIESDSIELLNSALDEALTLTASEFAALEDAFFVRKKLEDVIAEMIALGERDQHRLAAAAVSRVRRTL